MPRRIAIIQGHPDPAPERFCRALALAYAQAADEAGHDVRELDVAALALPPLHSRSDWQEGTPPRGGRRGTGGHRMGRSSGADLSAVAR